jgi:hypothetical protein
MARVKKRRQKTDIPVRKKLVFTSVVCGTVVALALGGFELSLRWQFGKIERITGAGEWEAGRFGDLTYHWDQYHPRYGWTNVPGYESDERIPFDVRINAQGLRAVRDYDPNPPDRVTRIALFGDSCTFGEEVDDDQTIAHHLEQHLTDAEVLNFGVHGYGLGQMVMRLEEEAFELNPDRVVIVILLPMNLYRDPMPNYVYNKPVFSAANGELHVANVPVPEASQLPWLYRHCFAAAWFFSRSKDYHMPPDVQSLVATSQAIVRRANTLCDRHDVKLNVVTIVSYGTVDELKTDVALRELLDYLTQSIREADVEVLNLVHFIEQAYADEGAALTKPHGHWSGRGNCLIAGQIAKHLARSAELELDASGSCAGP